MAVQGFEVARQLGDDGAAASAFSRAQLGGLAEDALCGFVASAVIISIVIATPWSSALSVKPGALPADASEQPSDKEGEAPSSQQGAAFSSEGAGASDDSLLAG